MTRKAFMATSFAGLPGVIALSFLGVPEILEGKALPAPMWVLRLASGIQSVLLLAIAAYVGARLAPKVGLHAPAILALAESRSAGGFLRRQYLPGILGGALGAVLLWSISCLAADVAEPLKSVKLPIIVRLLYGGITEEVLVRWGLMSTIVWIFWRVVQRGSGAPQNGIFWIAIVISALLFGAGHLPAAMALAEAPSAGLIVYIIGGNAAFGLLAGYLFWRYGLESAIMAHLLTHVFLLGVQP